MTTSAMRKILRPIEVDFEVVGINQLTHVVSIVGIGILFGLVFLIFELALNNVIVFRRKRKQEIYKKLGFTSF